MGRASLLNELAAKCVVLIGTLSVDLKNFQLP